MAKLSNFFFNFELTFAKTG